MMIKPDPRDGSFAMERIHSKKLCDDVNRTVCAALYDFGILNIPLIAEQVRARNSLESVSLDDLEHLVLGFGQLYSAPIEFDRSAFPGRIAEPVSSDNDGLLIEFVSGETTAA